MPTITNEEAFDGVLVKIDRLGLAPLVDEIKDLITNFTLLLEEKKHANGAAIVREMIDARFDAAGGWNITKSGGIDWKKSLTLNREGARVCVGVELQVSSRSDLLTNDLTHLMGAIEAGEIDVGVIVVPSDATAYFLTDRCPYFSSALDHVRRAKGQFSPLLILAISHDGSGPPLPKKRTNLGKNG